MTARGNLRGKPVVAFVALLAGWCTVRFMLWEAPFSAPLESPGVALARPDDSVAGPREAAPLEPASLAQPPTPLVLRAREPVWTVSAVDRQSPPETSEEFPSAPALVDDLPAVAPLLSAVVDDHSYPLADTYTQSEVRSEPVALASCLPAHADRMPAFPGLVGDSSRSSGKRWSGGSWVLLREDTTTPITSGRGSYGQSQAGSVLRYRMAPSSRHRVAAYARASTGLAKVDDPEVAVGVTARPVPGLPVAVAAEVRAARLYYGTAVRRAVFAYSELPPFEMLAGVRGEAYVQGGYVDGRFASAFIDGQVRLDRQFGRFGNAELRAGGGAWGGAQEGAKRLDLGPAATIAAEFGGAPLRMSADWRFRVAGDANPGSGPALTISTAF